MAKRSTSRGVQADASLKTAKRTISLFRNMLTAHHGGHGASLREADHNGHYIVIETTYKVKVDGKLFKAHLDVSNGGQVHYHGMPNVSFESAIDLIKAVIDQFPNHFPKEKVQKKPPRKLLRKLLGKDSRKLSDGRRSDHHQ